MGVALADLRSIVSTTWQQAEKTIHDQVFSGSPLWERLKARKNIVPYTGGTMISEIVGVDRNPTINIRRGKAVTPLQEYDPLRTVGWNHAWVDGSITIYDEDRYVNRGPAEIRDFADAIIQNTEDSFQEGFEQLSWGDGTLDLDGNPLPANTPPFLGLQAMIDDNNTYAFLQDADGGFTAINRALAANSWWRSYVDDAAVAWDVDGANGLRHTYNSCTRGYGREKPDLIMCTQDIWETYASLLVPQQRFEDEKLAAAGFRNLMFDEAAVVWDLLCPGNTGVDGATYLLNTKWIKLRPHAVCAGGWQKGKWARLDASGIKAEAQLLVWLGQLTCRNPRFQGRMLNRTV
jgi:hypothetical protein